MGECQQQKHTQYASSSMQTECDYLYGWIWKQLHMQKSHRKWWTPDTQLGMQKKKMKNVQPSGLYHYTKFERNQSVNVLIQANVKGFVFCFFRRSHRYGSLPWLLNGQDKMSMKFITPTSLNRIPNFIQINWKLCELIGTQLFSFSHSCDLESRSKSITLVSKCRVQ